MSIDGAKKGRWRGVVCVCVGGGDVHSLTTGSVPCTKSGKNNQILQAQNQGKPKKPTM
jgi:hypothetical protein